MKKSDLSVFTAQLIELGEMFDATLSESKLLLYFEALSDVETEDVLGAIRAAVKACTFMPKPAELRTLAIGDAEDLAESAWMLFRAVMKSAGAYASLATSDPALGETILAVFGGWPEACRLDLSPEMWAAKRKEFGRVFRVLRDRQLTGSRYLFGLTEQMNGGRPQWLKFAQVAVLDGGAVRMLRGDQAEAYRTQLAANSSMRQIADGEMTPTRALETA